VIGVPVNGGIGVFPRKFAVNAYEPLSPTFVTPPSISSVYDPVADSVWFVTSVVTDVLNTTLLYGSINRHRALGRLNAPLLSNVNASPALALNE
jgi:hypothetical protein